MFAQLKSDTVTLLAMHTQTLNAFSPPQCRDDIEIWGIGHHTFGSAVATRVFEPHDEDYVLRRRNENTYLRHWYENLIECAHEKPVYTLRPWSRSLGPHHVNGWVPPGCRKNNFGKPFIESSVGYMFAAAYCYHRINPFIRQLRCYGVSLDGASEYAYQKPNAMFYIGGLMSLGVQIYFPEGCKMFHSAWPSGEYGTVESLGPLKPNVKYDLSKPK